MSGMHQPIAQDLSIGNQANEPILHVIDFEDVALSKVGAKLVHHGARVVMRQFMPAGDTEKLTAAQAVALFVDKVYWEENTGGLIMCTDVADKSLCLPIPKAHWKVRGDTGTVQ